MLAPKTIDNDLGLNYRNEPDEWVRSAVPERAGIPLPPARRRAAAFDLDQMVNYVTPGYATAVFVSAEGVQRIRTTAESHRRIAIVEVMGRHSGYIALGAAYGQPDILLVPEHRLNVDARRAGQEIYDLQKHVRDRLRRGHRGRAGPGAGRERQLDDPPGNVILTGAAEALRQLLIQHLGDAYFRRTAAAESAQAAIFTQKGRPHPARRPADPVRPLLRAPSSAATRWTCCSRGR